jgi:hypothetical protein
MPALQWCHGGRVPHVLGSEDDERPTSSSDPKHVGSVDLVQVYQGKTSRLRGGYYEECLSSSET